MIVNLNVVNDLIYGCAVKLAHSAL
uniref:Uncharacterized protein n=1 Tax=Anguilla anguilla TaxID=7936 RepID=A0A0E9VCR5_ANGAN